MAVAAVDEDVEYDARLREANWEEACCDQIHDLEPSSANLRANAKADLGGTEARSERTKCWSAADEPHTSRPGESGRGSGRAPGLAGVGNARAKG